MTKVEPIFDLMLESPLLKAVLNYCLNTSDEDVYLRQSATHAICDFAMNKKSIKLLISLGVMDVFETFKEDIKVKMEANMLGI